MDRDQRSRQQKSRGGSFTRPAAKRSLSSRMGLQKGPAPRPSPRPQNRRARPPQPAPAPPPPPAPARTPARFF